MAYKEVIKRKGALLQKHLVETIDTTPKRGKKIFAREKIENEVFDLHDSVADNAKMISLLTSLLARIYGVLPDDTKDLLSDDDRGVIEYTFTKFDSIDTRADVQFAEEGLSTIDKLLDRQGAIGVIVK